MQDNKPYNEKAPCMNCEDRYVGCHSKCEKYLQFKKNIDNKVQSKINYHKEHMDTKTYAKKFYRNRHR